MSELGIKECSPGLYEAIVQAAEAEAALHDMNRMAELDGRSQHDGHGAIPIGVTGRVLIWTQWEFEDAA